MDFELGMLMLVMVVLMLMLVDIAMTMTTAGLHTKYKIRAVETTRPVGAYVEPNA